MAGPLRVPSPDPVEDALARATLLQQASKAGYKVLEEMEYDDQHGVVALVKQRIEQRNFAAWERLGTQADDETPSELYARIRLAMIDAERARVLEVRDAGQVATRWSRGAGDARRRGVDDRRREASRAELQTEYSRCGGPAPPASTSSRGPSRRSTGPARSVSGAWTTVSPGSRSGVPELPEHRLLRLLGARHATAHFRDTAHPVIQSAEPLEDWRWCYVHHVTA